ncbi:MAG: hypothetical protein HC837_17040 [Chloroflexaceae bacterium]|nr:hypothetical protein [Chloroflexaceae bacterium]
MPTHNRPQPSKISTFVHTLKRRSRKPGLFSPGVLLVALICSVLLQPQSAMPQTSWQLFELAWSSIEADFATQSIAAGDVDGDGDLDLATGNSGRSDLSDPTCIVGATNRIYRNDNGSLTPRSCLGFTRSRCHMQYRLGRC